MAVAFRSRHPFVSIDPKRRLRFPYSERSFWSSLVPRRTFSRRRLVSRMRSAFQAEARVRRPPEKKPHRRCSTHPHCPFEGKPCHIFFPLKGCISDRSEAIARAPLCTIDHKCLSPRPQKPSQQVDLPPSHRHAPTAILSQPPDCGIRAPKIRRAPHAPTSPPSTSPVQRAHEPSLHDSLQGLPPAAAASTNSPAARRMGRRAGVQTGCSTCCRDTSASLLIQENASPDVRADLEASFEGLAPEAPAPQRRRRGPGRHARPYPRRPYRRQSLDPRRRRPAGAGDLAGPLPVRAPPARTCARSLLYLLGP